MAGIMLRVTKPFHAGDFVTVDDYFGRVVERGLFDTEIQTENRELVAFPNTYMINTPLTVTRNSGTVIATTLSLGYDIHHSRVESLLLDAAEKCGLEAPFVQILELGDYSITYKISGILTEVESLLTARSNLYRSVLDTLHGNSIEIVSPAFMNQRRVADDAKIIPEKLKQIIPENVPVVEDIVFDKADRAGQIETEKQILLDKIQQYEIDLEQAPKDERKLIQQKIDDCKQQLESNQQINEAQT
jgi:small-conductance mechanosensitive channel